MVYATTGYTIATNGQTLVVAAPTVGGATATVYTTAACTAAHTFPQVITSDTTYYVDPTGTLGRYLVSACQPDGTELWGQKVDCFAGDGIKTISPLPTAAQSAADLAAYPFGRLVSGYYYYTNSGHAVSAQPATVGNLALSPWWVPNDVTLAKIGAEVTGAGGSGSVFRIGIYADNGSGYPGALILDAGTIDGTSATVQDITTSQVLAKGLYWAGGVGQVGTAPTVRMFNDQLLPLPLSVSTATPAAGALTGSVYQSSVTGALPATFTTTRAAQTSIYGPRIHFKVA